MKNKVWLRIISIAILTIVFAIGAQAQETVVIDQKTADAAAKAFDTVEAQDKLIVALKGEIVAKQNESLAKDSVIKIQAEQLDLFRKLKCPTVSVFFGLYKKKSCF